MVKLGQKVKDKITGFEGIVTGRCEYLTGCAQVLLVPQVDNKGALQDSRWFDEPRVKITQAKPIDIDMGASKPGADMPAPIK